MSSISFCPVTWIVKPDLAVCAAVGLLLARIQAGGKVLISPCIVDPAEVKLTAGKPPVLSSRVVTFEGALPMRQLNSVADRFSPK